ncbi:MAG: nitroreductase family protein [Cyanobacteria bacterium P01_G01_bin.38]
MYYIANNRPGRLSRRQLLKFAGVSALGVATSTLIMTQATDSLSYDDMSKQVWQAPGLATPLQEMVYYATLAPSHYNSQPWQFKVADHTIQIFPDRSRQLSVSDPDQRALMIGLGSALENLLLSASFQGYGNAVRYFPEGQSVVVQLQPPSETAPEAAQGLNLFQAMLQRRSTYAPYSGTPVPPDRLAQLEAVTASVDIGIQLLTAYRQLRTVSDAVQTASLYQYSNPAFLGERLKWLRFNETEASHHRDGLFYRCLGKATVPRWWGTQRLNHTDANVEATQAARLTQQASGLALIVTRSDDPIAWVKAGRAYERFALNATALGIKTSLQNAVIEVPQVRSQIRRTFDLQDNYPQLLVRFGYGPDTVRSLRRPLSEVLTSDQGLPVESTVHQI